ncbi:MAG: SDR family oxidoreductase [Saprospiraceae bacterium]|nr:SDR family oxidoreductase [Saprospiraceae bacterium]
MFQSDLFKGKTALVTGGGSGIGFEIARQFLTLGAEVYIAGRKQERLDQAILKLHHFGSQVKAVVLDIRDTTNIKHLADMIETQSGKLDILINNAGGQFPSPAENITEKGWNAVINTNLNGTWFVTQEMAKRFFFNQQSGSIVNIVLNNFKGFPGMSHSAAARAGVMNLTQTLAIEWVNRGIRINCVAPGIILSSGLENYPKEMVAGIEAKIPMKRLGTVAEVAELTLFLAHAAYITGETVYIDGGNRFWGDMWEI